MAITGQRTVNQRYFLELCSLNNHNVFIFPSLHLSELLSLKQLRQFHYIVLHVAPDNKTYSAYSIVSMECYCWFPR